MSVGVHEKLGRKLSPKAKSPKYKRANKEKRQKMSTLTETQRRSSGAGTDGNRQNYLA